MFDSQNADNIERIPVYQPQPPPDPQREFKEQWRNVEFRRSRLTYLSLFFLMVLYPVTSLVSAEDPATIFDRIDQFELNLILISTIFVQWALFLLVFLTTFREQTGLSGLGFTRIRLLNILQAVAFLALAYLTMAFVSWVLAVFGMPLPGEIGLLIPTDSTGRIVWVLVSITAGICEEAAFRGYLMTRLRLLGNFRSWTWPVIISSVVFGICHYSYQGIPGLIVISIYGALLGLLFVYTRSLWPPILAHALQDLSALFVPMAEQSLSGLWLGG